MPKAPRTFWKSLKEMTEDILAPLRAEPALIDALRLDTKYLISKMALAAPETTLVDPGHTDLLPAMLAHVASLVALMSKSARLMDVDPEDMDEDRLVLAFKNMVHGVVSLADEETPESFAAQAHSIKRHIAAGTRPTTLHDFVVNYRFNNDQEG